MEDGCAADRLRRLFTFLRFTTVNILPTLRRFSARLRFTAVMQPPDLRRLFTLLRFSAVNIPSTLRRLSALLRFSAVIQPPDLRRFFTLPYCTAVIVSPSKEHVSRLTSFTNVQKKYCFVSINENNEPTPLKIKNIMPLVSRSRFIIKNSE